MNVQVRLFAGPREAVGSRDVILSLAQGARVSDLLDALVREHPALARWREHALVSVNREFATGTHALMEGDEVAFMPPVSGGGDARLAEGDLSVDALLSTLKREGAGAAVAFLGIVRNSSGERPGARVDRLEFEAYEPMAEREMETLLAHAKSKFRLVDAAIRHRLGALDTGENVVLVVVTAPHRREAFEATEWIMSELKSTVPIWKKEISPAGDKWVNDG